jgi:toxin ParE1/3/4
LAQEGGTELAERIVNSFDDRFEALAQMPRSGRARPEISAYMRSFPVGKYLIYYENPPKRRIVIARVLHGKRDQRAALLN